MKEKIILVGCGQHARVIIYNIKAQGKYDIACFTDGNSKNIGKTFEGYPIAGTDEDIEYIKNKYNTNKFIIALGDMKLREKLFEKYMEAGMEPVNVIHPNAVISPQAEIGKGVLIECGCLITPNPVIGNNVVVNTGSQVNHDNVVEDHVYIASGVVLSGGVHICQNTLLDDGVIVTLGKRVAANSIIGAGAVVTKDLAESGIYIGTPAHRIRGL